jgi:hypothetical protein
VEDLSLFQASEVWFFFFCFSLLVYGTSLICSLLCFLDQNYCLAVGPLFDLVEVYIT